MIILAGHGDKRRADGSWIKDGKLRGYTNKIDQVNETHIVFDYDSPVDSPTEREGTGGPGDSGGPAFIVKGNTYYVAGVSSMGEPGVNGPASFGATEHYVRVSKFQDWILQTIKEKNPDKAYRFEQGSPVSHIESIEWPNTVQARHAKIIVEALVNYSEEKMMVAISQAYDESVLKKRTEKEIIQNMLVLVRELQNTRPGKILGETPAKLSVQMNKGSQQYVLDIFFFENSQKIEQMGFGKLN